MGTGSTVSVKLSLYLMLEFEVHGAGSLEGTIMRKLEACEDGPMPTSILVASDFCEGVVQQKLGLLVELLNTYTWKVN